MQDRSSARGLDQLESQHQMAEETNLDKLRRLLMSSLLLTSHRKTCTLL